MDEDKTERMREKLRDSGLEIAVPSADLMEDHLSVELEYLAALGSVAEREEFARLHLQNWVPRFCADVEKYAETEFYRAANSALTLTFSLSEV